MLSPGSRSNLKKRIVYYIGAKNIDGLADRTLENYAFFLNQFADRVNKHVSKINTDDVREYITFLSREKGLKEARIQTHINVLRAFVSWLHIKGVIKKTMAKIKSLKIDKKISQHALAAEELEQLRNTCRAYKEKTLVEFLVSSGCRLSEAAGIKIASMNFEERSVRVTGKGNKERLVYFSVRAKVMIEEYILQRKGGRRPVRKHQDILHTHATSSHSKGPPEDQRGGFTLSSCSPSSTPTYVCVNGTK